MSGFLNNSVRAYTVKMKIDMLYHAKNTFGNIVFWISVTVSLIFQPIFKPFTTIRGLRNTLTEWESKGFSNEKVNLPYTANHSLSPKNIWMNNSRIRLNIKERSLKQGKPNFTPNNVLHLFVVYKIDTWPQVLNPDFTRRKFSAKLTKNANPDKYKYSGYSIGFGFWFWIFINGSVGKNVTFLELIWAHLCILITKIKIS